LLFVLRSFLTPRDCQPSPGCALFLPPSLAPFLSLFPPPFPRLSRWPALIDSLSTTQALELAWDWVEAASAAQVQHDTEGRRLHPDCSDGHGLGSGPCSTGLEDSEKREDPEKREPERGLSRDDPRTWDDDRWPRGVEGGILPYLGPCSRPVCRCICRCVCRSSLSSLFVCRSLLSLISFSLSLS
jgi:hypothetical protein